MIAEPGPRFRSALLLLTVYLSLGLLAMPDAATARPDPLLEGTTTITVAVPFGHLLASHGVSLSAMTPADRKGAAVRLPLAEGVMDPTAQRLELEAAGAITFSRGHRSVIFRHLKVRTARVPLIAKVGGGQLKIATAAHRHLARQGFGATFKATGLRLSAKVATRLSKKLDLPEVFKPGQLLGSVRASVMPATVAILPKGRVTLTPDPAFLAKLDSVFVSLNPIAPAERQTGPFFTMPLIPAGTIALDGGSGVARSGGGLEFLQQGAGQVFWHELWFDPQNQQVFAEVDIEPTPTYPGKLGQVGIAGLAPGSVSADPTLRTVSVAGEALTLNAETAGAFNEAFARPQGMADVFFPGEALGDLSFVAQTE